MTKLLLRSEAFLVSEEDVKIMDLLSKGHTARSAGAKLGKNPRTLEQRLEKLREAISAKTTLELMANFYESGILPIKPENQSQQSL